MTPNEKVRNVLKHYIDLELYANGVAHEIAEMLLELYETCDDAIRAINFLRTKNDYNVIYSNIEEFIEDFEETFLQKLKEEADIVKEQERTFLSKTYDNLKVGAVTTAAVLFVPFDGKDTTKTFVERSTRNIRRTYDAALRSGYMFGQTSEDVVKQASIGLKQVSRGIDNGVITAIPSYAKNTDRIVFIKNNSETVWCSTLDGNTCLSCAYLSGQHFKSASEAPSIPHNLCRCVLLKADEIEEPIPTYKEFVESLSEEDQIKVLGKNRYNLWKEDGITLERFINNGEVIPLDELKESLDIRSDK